MRPSSLTRLNAEKNDGCAILGAAPTSFPGRAVAPTGTTTRCACCAPWNTNMTGRPCAEPSVWSAKPETGIRRSHSREKRPSWVPRARRLKLDIPLRYRVNKTSTWYEGIIENISQSGVLFNGPQQLPVNALIEMVFEMPEEISGQKNSNVVCQGRVMRAKARSRKRSVGVGGIDRGLQVYSLISRAGTSHKTSRT